MKEIFYNIENSVLDNLEMSDFISIGNLEYQNYFLEKSSKEHYRLLTYLTNQFDNIKILDIGTLKGCSALALSKNKSNKVFSFNLSDQLELIDLPSNVEFIIDNILNGKYDDLILGAEIILLDTFHDGTFELEFLNYLKKINYRGLLILDDIFLNEEMKSFWNNIELDKLDVTKLGHSTGTGLVFLN